MYGSIRFNQRQFVNYKTQGYWCGLAIPGNFVCFAVGWHNQTRRAIHSSHATSTPAQASRTKTTVFPPARKLRILEESRAVLAGDNTSVSLGDDRGLGKQLNRHELTHTDMT